MYRYLHHRLAFVWILWTAAPGLGLGQANPSAAPATAAESSVRPGLNAEYEKAGEHLDEWIGRFETEGREIYERRQQIVQAVKVRPGATVADVGAGTGLFSLLLADAVGTNGTVYAVDIVKDFLEHVKARAAAAAKPQVRTVLGSDRSVALPPSAIDVAFLCDAYHHFEFPRTMLASLHRSLRPGGELVVIDFKRVPGQSANWIFDHVRAGQEVFTAEIEAAGFKKVEQNDLLKDNYFLRFRKSD